MLSFRWDLYRYTDLPSSNALQIQLSTPLSLNRDFSIRITGAAFSTLVHRARGSQLRRRVVRVRGASTRTHLHTAHWWWRPQLPPSANAVAAQWGGSPDSLSLSYPHHAALHQYPPLVIYDSAAAHNRTSTCRPIPPYEKFSYVHTHYRRQHSSHVHRNHLRTTYFFPVRSSVGFTPPTASKWNRKSPNLCYSHFLCSTLAKCNYAPPSLLLPRTLRITYFVPSLTLFALTLLQVQTSFNLHTPRCTFRKTTSFPTINCCRI